MSAGSRSGVNCTRRNDRPERLGEAARHHRLAEARARPRAARGRGRGPRAGPARGPAAGRRPPSRSRRSRRRQPRGLGAASGRSYGAGSQVSPVGRRCGSGSRGRPGRLALRCRPRGRGRASARRRRRPAARAASGSAARSIPVVVGEPGGQQPDQQTGRVTEVVVPRRHLGPGQRLGAPAGRNGTARCPPAARADAGRRGAGAAGTRDSATAAGDHRHDRHRHEQAGGSSGEDGDGTADQAATPSAAAPGALRRGPSSSASSTGQPRRAASSSRTSRKQPSARVRADSPIGCWLNRASRNRSVRVRAGRVADEPHLDRPVEQLGRGVRAASRGPAPAQAAGQVARHRGVRRQDGLPRVGAPRSSSSAASHRGEHGGHLGAPAAERFVVRRPDGELPASASRSSQEVWRRRRPTRRAGSSSRPTASARRDPDAGLVAGLSCAAGRGGRRDGADDEPDTSPGPPR